MVHAHRWEHPAWDPRCRVGSVRPPKSESRKRTLQTRRHAADPGQTRAVVFSPCKANLSLLFRCFGVFLGVRLLFGVGFLLGRWILLLLGWLGFRWLRHRGLRVGHWFFHLLRWWRWFSKDFGFNPQPIVQADQQTAIACEIDSVV